MLCRMKGQLRSLVMAGVVGLLAACGTTRSVVVQPATRGGEVRVAPVRPAPRPAASGDYRVRRGDTLYSIAFRHGKDFRDVARWNGIAAPYTIWPGQLLHMQPPSGGEQVRPAPVRPVAGRAARPEPRPERLAETHGPDAATPHASPVPAESSDVPVAGEPHTSNPPPPAVSIVPGASRSVSGIVWRWPADGTVISRFKSGDAIPGIEIAGRAGSPIRAAADGVVVYSGNGLVGYGELIIVKHNDDFLSAYGHNRKRLVKEGQRVSAGQVIAEMGSTGASRDELQFQIRRSGNPVDPLDFLPAR
ncbi:MAG: peptidoglycan DD-metalloendopeptidase family protein [Xanthomonadaceae bacterium]|nr:peptidoglycan DD-metalloendopeptidase family protein [Xanthomonadaceae bacterium]MDE1963558.1 peptidoglycan DD-metalloendopeptidase family protein [Xanthomonadaceae bacterium]